MIVVAIFVARDGTRVAPAPTPIAAVASQPTSVDGGAPVTQPRTVRAPVRRQRIAPLAEVQEMNLTRIVVDSVDVARSSRPNRSKSIRSRLRASRSHRCLEESADENTPTCLARRRRARRKPRARADTACARGASKTGRAAGLTTAPPPPPPAPAPPAPRREGQPINIRVDTTISESGGNAPPVKKTVTAVAGDGFDASVREMATMPAAPPAPPAGPTSLNVDASPTILSSGKIRVRVTLQYAAGRGSPLLSSHSDGHPSDPGVESGERQAARDFRGVRSAVGSARDRRSHGHDSRMKPGYLSRRPFNRSSTLSGDCCSSTSRRRAAETSVRADTARPSRRGSPRR